MVTPLAIKNLFLGKGDKGKSLWDLTTYHDNTQHDMMTAGTMAHYQTTYRYLNKFLLNQLKVDNIFIKKIDYKFITEFDAFLRAYQPVDHQKRLSHNVVMKHLARLKKILGLAKKIGWIEKHPFDNYTISYTKVDRGHLSEEDISNIRSKKLSNERLAFTRDLFVFSCYTGLSYIDVAELKPEHIVKGIDGGLWIFTKRHKTDTTIHIPILPEALEIIERYQEHPRALHKGLAFPIISNQKLNSYLKEIGDICNINKNITFHLARHTFATTITLSNGVPIETVSKLLGHTKLSTTQIYARVLDHKIGNDMQDLKHKMQATTNKAYVKRVV